MATQKAAVLMPMRLVQSAVWAFGSNRRAFGSMAPAIPFVQLGEG
eukprot:CAMPEP_0119057694 /NCGR_PEP_ID=MMETSP1178-20130426/2099_1 /TAXON_ID=33656 /ORGANISM="unid sp, Strain CCMP2000" /LENGTH=44 /DNA_ID= /DNA_START= /DNA_END= /DNA_ORIENTATION=